MSELTDAITQNLDEIDAAAAARPASKIVIVNREEYEAVTGQLRRLSDSGDCGHMLEDLVTRMEKWQ